MRLPLSRSTELVETWRALSRHGSECPQCVEVVAAIRQDGVKPPPARVESLCEEGQVLAGAWIAALDGQMQDLREDRDHLYPAPRLLWSIPGVRHLSNEQQERRAEILTRYVPDREFQRLLRIPDDRARERLCQAIERAYAPQWDARVAEEIQVEQFLTHYALHEGCPGRFLCQEWNPPEVGAERKPGTCANCGRRTKGGRELCYDCWRVGKLP